VRGLDPDRANLAPPLFRDPFVFHPLPARLAHSAPAPRRPPASWRSRTGQWYPRPPPGSARRLARRRASSPSARPADPAAPAEPAAGPGRRAPCPPPARSPRTPPLPLAARATGPPRPAGSTPPWVRNARGRNSIRCCRARPRTTFTSRVRMCTTVAAPPGAPAARDSGDWARAPAPAAPRSATDARGAAHRSDRSSSSTRR
jgi:hypothetical protein